MESIKESFRRVKKDMDTLFFEIDSLKISLRELHWRVTMVAQDIQKVTELQKNKGTDVSTQTQKAKTDRHINQTDNRNFKPLNNQNLGISTGNEGVQTDRQTDRQTIRQTQNPPIVTKKRDDNPIADAAQMLASLDTLKKEIRRKFKRLTTQEIAVFSALYVIEEEKGYADYTTIAHKLNLTQSSIRDYVSRLIDKGIPVDKIKINNKSIRLNIASDLKKVATLQTILTLREL